MESINSRFGDLTLTWGNLLDLEDRTKIISPALRLLKASRLCRNLKRQTFGFDSRKGLSAFGLSEKFGHSSNVRILKGGQLHITPLIRPAGKISISCDCVSLDIQPHPVYTFFVLKQHMAITSWRTRAVPEAVLSAAGAFPRTVERHPKQAAENGSAESSGK